MITARRLTFVMHHEFLHRMKKSCGKTNCKSFNECSSEDMEERGVFEEKEKVEKWNMTKGDEMR
jgi:Mn-dependent DtxR family transcriptional regulator